MQVVMRMARNEDLENIVKLLNQGKLNVEGIEGNIANFMVVEKDEQAGLIATAGFEVLEEGVGLLRSLAVRKEDGSTEIVLGLIKVLLELAAQRGVKFVYLLTPSTDFFEYLGFQKIAVEHIPHSLQQSTHFQKANAEISTVMVYREVDKLRQSAQN